MKPYPIIFRIVKSVFPGALDLSTSIKFNDEGIEFTVTPQRMEVHLIAQVERGNNIDERIQRDTFNRDIFAKIQGRMAKLTRRIRQRGI